MTQMPGENTGLKDSASSADILRMAAAVTKVCNPELYSLQDAIRYAKDTAQASPGFEIELVRFLQAKCMSVPLPLQAVLRGLDVLGGVLEGGRFDESRLITLLRPFMRSGDPQIASKCALILGRRLSSVSSLNGIIDEIDDNIRASLVESLWGRKEPEVEMVLRAAVRDSHPRVAANAVYGLYALGVDGWAAGLERLVGHVDAHFRVAGIQVLKSSGMPDALPRIKLLIRDTDADVRHAAFDALIHLRDHGPKNTPAAA